MNELRIIAASLLLLLGALVAVINWRCVIVSMRNKRKGIDRHHSTVPLISLITTGFASFIYPLELKSWIGLIPALDLGNWMLLVGLPIAIAQGAFKRKEKNTEQRRPPDSLRCR
jgi:hypothetical protein